MNRRLAFYTILTSALAVSLVAGSLHLGSYRKRADLADVRSRMASEPWEWSARHLASLTGRRGVGEDARAGLAVVQTLAGGDLSDDAPPHAEAFSSFPVEGLLRRAFEERRYDGCLALVDLLRRAGAPTFSEFEAAALLELGRSEEAAQVAFADQPATRMRRRLARALSEGSDRILVRDRAGTLLGSTTRTGENRFVPEDGIPENLVPRAAIDGLSQLDSAGSVRLTIDAGLSRSALSALGRYRGSIVVVDPYSGSVLAAVSDRKSFRRGGSPALEQMREPASIAKLITTSAALRAGVDVDSVMEDLRCRGSIELSNELLYCSAINGDLRGLDRAMAVSCNVAFAHLGDMIGREALIDEYRTYGFAVEREPRDFLGAVLEPEGSDRQLGDLSIGLEASAITPVHAALQAGTVANGGYMHRPRLFRSTDGVLGFSERPLPVEDGWQVLDDEWLPILTRAMEAVVAPGGTAARVAPNSFPVALKTGTASHPGLGFHVNYIGFGPTEAPRYAFAVRITHQPTSRRVRRAAYAVTQRFLRSLSRYAPPEPPPFGVLAAGS